MVRDAQMDVEVAKSMWLRKWVNVLMCENDELKLQIAKLKRSRRK